MRKPGRPPAGAKAKARLNAIAVVLGVPQWRVIVSGVECVLENMPAADRRVVESLVKRQVKR